MLLEDLGERLGQHVSTSHTWCVPGEAKHTSWLTTQEHTAVTVWLQGIAGGLPQLCSGEQV